MSMVLTENLYKARHKDIGPSPSYCLWLLQTVGSIIGDYFQCGWVTQPLRLWVPYQEFPSQLLPAGNCPYSSALYFRVRLKTFKTGCIQNEQILFRWFPVSKSSNRITLFGEEWAQGYKHSRHVYSLSVMHYYRCAWSHPKLPMAQTICGLSTLLVGLVEAFLVS